MTFSEAIQTLRAELHLSRIEQLAVLLNVSASTICRWERGNRLPTHHHRFLLARLAKQHGLKKNVVAVFESSPRSRSAR